MNKIIKINNFREKYSSHLDIFNPENSKYNFCKYINNNKIININNFILKIKNKKIKYSTYYTNPYQINKKIVSVIKFDSNRINTLKTNKFNVNLLDKILINNTELSKSDENYLELIFTKKKINNIFISIEETFLIMIYLTKHDKFILDKKYYFGLLNYYWLKIKLGTFDSNEIINEFTNIDNLESSNVDPIQFICKIKFNTSFYILFEEFHYKYILAWLNFNKFNYQTDKFILNSNYVKLNPQEIINDCYGEYLSNIPNLKEQMQIPLGHNILLIFNFNKVYYYDPDEQDLYDIFKLTKLFNQIGIKFTNISNRQPIQTITDDCNCLFYCLRFVQYILEFNTTINFDNLKTIVLVYEKKILNSNDMFEWIKKFVY
jgi:hypothetical protein